MMMVKYPKHQAGGTLTGLIIGIIIGLLIAVGVALMMKNSPVPFAGKGSKAGAAADAASAKDPNEPLYPKRDLMESVAREISKKAADNEQGAADALKSLIPLFGQKEPAPAETGPVAKAPPPEQATAVQKTDKPAEAINGLIYYLQVGAYSNRTDADGVRGQLALIGLSANITERPSDKGTLYRVRVGPFSKPEEMAPVRSKLAENGFQVAIVRP